MKAVQLYELVEEYQLSGDLSRLLADSYELLRWLNGFGKTAEACHAGWYYLLPVPADRDQDRTDLFDDFKARLAEANDVLEGMGIHPAGIHTTGYFPYGFVEGAVIAVYGWNGNQLFVAQGEWDESADPVAFIPFGVNEVSDRDHCKPYAIPFVALVKLVLILASEAVDMRRRED